MLRILQAFSTHTRWKHIGDTNSIATMEPVDATTSSVSRIQVEIDVRGRGTLQAVLARHLAPLTCSALLKGLPVEDRVHRFADRFLYVESRLTIGAEKQRTAFKRGDLAFMTSNSSVCFFVKDGPVAQRLNPIGYIKSKIEILDTVQAGDVILIRRTG